MHGESRIATSHKARQNGRRRSRPSHQRKKLCSDIESAINHEKSCEFLIKAGKPTASYSQITSYCAAIPSVNSCRRKPTGLQPGGWRFDPARLHSRSPSRPRKDLGWLSSLAALPRLWVRNGGCSRCRSRCQWLRLRPRPPDSWPFWPKSAPSATMASKPRRGGRSTTRPTISANLMTRRNEGRPRGIGFKTIGEAEPAGRQSGRSVSRGVNRGR